MGPVFCSLALIRYVGLLGSYWMIISHGLCSACIFFILDVFYKFIGSRRFFLLRGSNFFLPVFSLFWFFLCISNMGVPPTFNFFSEVFIIFGMLVSSFWLIYLVFILGLVRGFYRVFLYSFLRHGGSMVRGLKFDSLKMLDFLTLFFCSIYLLFFAIFFSCFCYLFSLNKTLICGINNF